MRRSSFRAEVLQFFIIAGYDDVLSAVISKETRIRELLMMPLIRKRLRVNLAADKASERAVNYHSLC